MDNLGQPKPRHQYILYPQAGRRGIMVHNGQYPNGAPYVGSTGGMGIGMMGYGGMGGYPGVSAHISPLYYGPNVHRSTYSNYAGYMGGYTGLSYGVANYPPYSYPNAYMSPYASAYGYGYANHHPYQRTYYGMNPVMAGGAHSYSYPGVAQTIIPPSTTTYTTVTNSAVPVPVAPMATATTSTTRIRPNVHAPHMQSPRNVRDNVQYENQRVAMERGSYLPRRIAPADARPDDPFWCKEVTGEWHLRTYYQIENECHPGRWLMDAEHGFLVFHRQCKSPLSVESVELKDLTDSETLSVLIQAIEESHSFYGLGYLLRKNEERSEEDVKRLEDEQRLEDEMLMRLDYPNY